MDAHSSGCATDLMTGNYKFIYLLLLLSFIAGHPGLTNVNDYDTYDTTRIMLFCMYISFSTKLLESYTDPDMVTIEMITNTYFDHCSPGALQVVLLDT